MHTGLTLGGDTQAKLYSGKMATTETFVVRVTLDVYTALLDYKQSHNFTQMRGAVPFRSHSLFLLLQYLLDHEETVAKMSLLGLTSLPVPC